MRSFKHISARTADEACDLLEKYKRKAVLQAGGTDLLSILKGEILSDYPKAVIDIKTISGLDYIREEEGTLRIGALTRLSDIAKSPIVMERWRGLAEASRAVATPQIRNAATLGGNLCQDVRCWYYRYPRSIGGPIMMPAKRERSLPCCERRQSIPRHPGGKEMLCRLSVRHGRGAGRPRRRAPDYRVERRKGNPCQ